MRQAAATVGLALAAIGGAALYGALLYLTIRH